MKNKILANIIVLFIISIPIVALSEDVTIVNCSGPDDCDLSSLLNMGGDFQTLLKDFVVSLAAVGFAIIGVKGLTHPDSVDVKKEITDTLKNILIGLGIFLLAFSAIKIIINELVNPEIDALRFLQ